MNDSADIPDTPIQLDGSLLLADPSLRDEYFCKSVILLAEHEGDDGAHGIILNHPLGRTVGELLKGEEFAPLYHLPVHLGGPVGRENLHFAALWEDPEGQLGFATRISARDAIGYTHRPGALVCAYTGYSGWESGQLEEEIRKQSWITTPAGSSILSLPHQKNLWVELMRKISPYHRILAETPDDIFMN